MYRQLKKQLDDKKIIEKNIEELEERIRFKIQKQLGLRGTTFTDIKIFGLGETDDKFLTIFSQIENLDKDRLQLLDEYTIIDNFINDILKLISQMGNLELDVFKNRYILGLTQQETANRLNYTIDRIKQIDRNIKAKIKDYTFITP